MNYNEESKDNLVHREEDKEVVNEEVAIQNAYLKRPSSIKSEQEPDHPPRRRGFCRFSNLFKKPGINYLSNDADTKQNYESKI